ncbi:MAG: family 43 glycosylhydrolase [Blastocatellia bacterium]
MNLIQRSLFLSLVFTGLLISTGCLTQTVVSSDGSGEISMLFPLTEDEVKSDPKRVCSDLRPDPRFTAQASKNGDQTWCFQAARFADPSDLRQLYLEMGGVTVNQLEIRENKFIYDIRIKPSTRAQFTWIVKMPGRIINHNASVVEGNTLKWEDLFSCGSNRLYAESSVTGNLPIIPPGSPIEAPISDLPRKRMVALVFGQSNSANYGETLYAPQFALYNFHAGKLYKAKDPLLGATGYGGSVWTRFGDKLIADGLYDAAVFISIGEGGSSVAEWAPGGRLHSKLLDAIRSARQQGLTITHLLWHQGESDAGKTSTNDYKARFLAMFSAVRQQGVTAPIYVAVASRSILTPGDPAIQRAQQELVNPAQGIYAGPNTDMLDRAFRYDWWHFNHAGLDRHADLWRVQLKRQRTYANPVWDDDFPDPFVLRVCNNYFAFSTNARGENIPVIKSNNLAHWEKVGDALPRLSSWAAPNRSLTWAPSVIQRGDKFVMYYTAHHIATRRQCIGRAISNRPEGPYVDDSSAPFVCQTNLGGSIDPSPFLDGDGKLYLLWKNDGNCCGQSAGIWIQQLSDDGLALVGQYTELLRHDQSWESPLIEGPAMLKEGGRYYLFYSANKYESEDYAVGYATSRFINGPFSKPQYTPILAKNEIAKGPGGQEFFTDADGKRWMAYHAWKPGAVGYGFRGSRSFRIEQFSFQNGKPVIVGPTAGATIVR